MPSLLFQELNNDPTELSGLFEIHEMAHIIDDYAARPGYTCLDGACMRMDVWNVSVANKQQGWDLWGEAWRKKVARGEVIVVRYADDLVLCFQYRADAERLPNCVQERPEKFGLELRL